MDAVYLIEAIRKVAHVEIKDNLLQLEINQSHSSNYRLLNRIIIFISNKENHICKHPYLQL